MIQCHSLHFVLEIVSTLLITVALLLVSCAMLCASIYSVHHLKQMKGCLHGCNTRWAFTGPILLFDEYITVLT